MDETLTYAQFVQRMVVGESSFERFVMGLGSEAGELLGKAERWKRGDYKGDKKLYYDHLFKELGDVVFWVQALCNHMGVELEEVQEGNRVKLEDRKRRKVILGEGDER